MNKVFPQPVEIEGDSLDAWKIAHRLGAAIADQHPGVQISEKVVPTGFEIELQHATHETTLSVPRAPTDTPTTLERAAKRIAMGFYLSQWRVRLASAIHDTEVTNANGDKLFLESGIAGLIELMRKLRAGSKFIFIGNGGSAAIASHMAEDFTKNGRVRAVTFNDAALLTCYANDFGWNEALAKAVEHHGMTGDVLVAISSSGKSENILRATDAARVRGIPVVTFSGFAPDNPLRKLGTFNFWTPAAQYGFVETAHAALLHAALDLHNGWVGA